MARVFPLAREVAGDQGEWGILFDANLSPKLVGRMAALLPDSIRVFDTGLARFTSDEAIWEYARNNGFVIVTIHKQPPSAPGWCT
jgi:hypothetical protein